MTRPTVLPGDHITLKPGGYLHVDQLNDGDPITATITTPARIITIDGQQLISFHGGCLAVTDERLEVLPETTTDEPRPEGMAAT